MSLHKYTDIEPFKPIKYGTITFEGVVPLGNRPKLCVKILGPLPAPPTPVGFHKRCEQCDVFSMEEKP